MRPFLNPLFALGAGAILLAKNTFTAFSSDTSFIVPNGCNFLHAVMWGAGGAGMAYSSWTPRFAGGGGGFTEAIIPVTSLETLSVRVGRGGSAGNDYAPNNGAFNSSDGTAADGGGYSGIFRSTTPLVLAGGGGAGGTSYQGIGLIGGGGGGLVAETKSSGAKTVTGGNQSSGGTGGSGTSGSFLQAGGTAYIGGGGGYFGGSGEYLNFATGGSGFLGALEGRLIGAAGQPAANTAHPDYISGRAVGGSSGSGGDGLLIIRAYKGRPKI